MLHTIEHYPILEKRLQPLLSPRTSPLCGGSTTEKAFTGVECELPELGQESPQVDQEQGVALPGPLCQHSTRRVVG